MFAYSGRNFLAEHEQHLRRTVAGMLLPETATPTIVNSRQNLSLATTRLVANQHLIDKAAAGTARVAPSDANAAHAVPRSADICDEKRWFNSIRAGLGSQLDGKTMEPVLFDAHVPLPAGHRGGGSDSGMELSDDEPSSCGFDEDDGQADLIRGCMFPVPPAAGEQRPTTAGTTDAILSRLHTSNVAETQHAHRRQCGVAADALKIENLESDPSRRPEFFSLSRLASRLSNTNVSASDPLAAVPETLARLDAAPGRCVGGEADGAKVRTCDADVDSMLADLFARDARNVQGMLGNGRPVSPLEQLYTASNGSTTPTPLALAASATLAMAEKIAPSSGGASTAAESGDAGLDLVSFVVPADLHCDVGGQLFGSETPRAKMDSEDTGSPKCGASIAQDMLAAISQRTPPEHALHIEPQLLERAAGNDHLRPATALAAVLAELPGTEATTVTALFAFPATDPAEDDEILSALGAAGERTVETAVATSMLALSFSQLSIPQQSSVEEPSEPFPLPLSWVLEEEPMFRRQPLQNSAALETGMQVRVRTRVCQHPDPDTTHESTHVGLRAPRSPSV